MKLDQGFPPLPNTRQVLDEFDPDFVVKADRRAQHPLRRHHAEPDAARNLDTENKRVQQFAAGHRTQPGQCEQSRRDRRRRVDHRSEMRVVAFEDLGANRAEKSGIERVGTIAGNRLRLARKIALHYRTEKRKRHSWAGIGGFDRDLA